MYIPTHHIHEQGKVGRTPHLGAILAAAADPSIKYNFGNEVIHVHIVLHAKMRVTQIPNPFSVVNLTYSNSRKSRVPVQAKP